MTKTPNSLLTVGVLTRGIVSTQWALTLRRLKLPENTIFRALPGLPFDHARNQMVRMFLKDGSKYLLFLDDDVLPPVDVFEMLSAVPSEVVTGLYFKRQGAINPTIYREAHPLPTPVILPTGGNPVIEVDYAGGGCLLCHRSVFERIRYPWFEWKVDKEDLLPQDRVGEDFDFSRKARQAGIRIMAHTGVRCKHMGYGWSDEDGRFVAEPPTELA